MPSTASAEHRLSISNAPPVTNGSFGSCRQRWPVSKDSRGPCRRGRRPSQPAAASPFLPPAVSTSVSSDRASAGGGSHGRRHGVS
jgi:hypothetical protein